MFNSSDSCQKFQDYPSRGRLYYCRVLINPILSWFYKNHQYLQQQLISYFFHRKREAETSNESNLSLWSCPLPAGSLMRQKVALNFYDFKLIVLAKRKLVNIGNKFFFLKLTHIFLSRTLIFQVFAQSPAILNNQIFHSFIQIIIQILDLILSNLK